MLPLDSITVPDEYKNLIFLKIEKTGKNSLASYQSCGRQKTLQMQGVSYH